MNTIEYSVCFIGLGPAGIGAAYGLSATPHAKSTLCLEAGVAASERFCTILQGKKCRKVAPCQIISGVGGSSLLSGGKISLFPAGKAMSSIYGSDEVTERELRSSFDVLEQFMPMISPSISDEVRAESQEHYANLGFDFKYYDAYLYRQNDLVVGYDSLVRRVVESGVTVQTNVRVNQIVRENGRFRIHATIKGAHVSYLASNIILAVGRLGRSLMDDLDGAFDLGGSLNKLDVGVRIEFPSAHWPKFADSHNDLKLHFGDARTFCVCKNGYLAPYRMGDIFLLEGYSDPSSRSDFTNFAITVRVDGKASRDSFLTEVTNLTMRESSGLPVRQLLSEYMADVPIGRSKEITANNSSITFWKWGNVGNCGCNSYLWHGNV